jgi:hypothetical protein
MQETSPCLGRQLTWMNMHCSSTLLMTSVCPAVLSSRSFADCYLQVLRPNLVAHTTFKSLNVCSSRQSHALPSATVSMPPLPLCCRSYDTMIDTFPPHSSLDSSLLTLSTVAFVPCSHCSPLT